MYQVLWCGVHFHKGLSFAIKELGPNGVVWESRTESLKRMRVSRSGFSGVDESAFDTPCMWAGLC